MNLTDQTEKPKLSLKEYYTARISELTMEQLRLHPFAFNLIDAPSDEFQEVAFIEYWDKEESIQKCRNELVKLRGIL